MAAPKELLGDLLVGEGLVTQGDLDAALALQKREGGKLGYHLVALGRLSPEALSEFLQHRFGVTAQDVTGLVRDPAVLDILPARLATFYRVIPVSLIDNVLTVAMADAGRKEVLSALAQVTRYRIDPLIVPAGAVDRALEALYGGEKDSGVKLRLHGDHEFVISDKGEKIQPIVAELLHDGAPAVDWLRTALATAVKLKTRELHVSPEENGVTIALKLRGHRKDYFKLNLEKRGDLESLLDKLARLPPSAAASAPTASSHTGSPLEGRFRVALGGRRLSAMVSALPTLHGRRYTLRLVDEQLLGRAAVESLGAALTELIAFAGGATGLVLLAGPATAGKEQLLAGLLTELKARDAAQNPALIEDRTYAPLPGVMQVALDTAGGRSLGPALEAVFRQDPGFVAIHELHDPRELELAFLAAARKPVLAALATADACSALEYACEAGLQSAAKAGVLRGVLGVRAFTPLCAGCARALPAVEAAAIGLPANGAWKYNPGCPVCLDPAVRPRLVLAEWVATQWLPVKRALAGTLRADALRAALREEGHPLLAETARKAALAGKLDARELAGLP